MYRWYVVNTYSGHENKVKQNLEHRADLARPEAAVLRQIVVPTETVSEMKDNEKVTKEKRTMPGYVLVNMDLNEDSWQLVKGTPGVTGFVGASNEPVPLTQPEVDRLLHREVAQKVATKAQFSIGESVKVVPVLCQTSPARSPRSIRTSAEAQGPCVHLWPRNAGRGRLRPGQEDLRTTPWPRRSSQTIKLQAAGGQARPAPPVGPALGQHGINIMEFCKAFNAQTQERQRHDDPGRDHGVRGSLVHVHHEDAARRRPDHAGTEPRQGLGRAARRTRSASSPRPQITRDRREEAPRSQRQRRRAATKIIAGTARSMGVEVEA